MKSTKARVKLGVESVHWGHRIDDLDHFLACASKCGFQGVEFSQRVGNIFVQPCKSGKPAPAVGQDRFSGSANYTPRPVRDARELQEFLQKHGLELLSLGGGTLRQRCEFLLGQGFCEDGSPRRPFDPLLQQTRPWLHISSWPEETEIILREMREISNCPFILAIHPHWMMPLRRISEAMYVISRHGDDGLVKLLLDVAHSFVAEDLPADAIRKHHRDMVAIHWKDWKPDFGRWSQRYARGFCLPGEGIVNPACDDRRTPPFAKLATALKRVRYTGWIVAEINDFEDTRENRLLALSRWFRQHGVLLGLRLPKKEPTLPLTPRHESSSDLTHLLSTSRLKKYIQDQASSEDFYRTGRNSNPLKQTLYQIAVEDFAYSLGRIISRAGSMQPFYQGVVDSLLKTLASRNIVAAKMWSLNTRISSGATECYLLASGVIPRYRNLTVPITDTFDTLLTSHTNIEGCLIRKESPPLIFDIIDDPVMRPPQDLTLPDTRGRIAHPDFIYALNARWLLHVPVFNSANKHHLEYVVSLFFSPDPGIASTLVRNREITSNDISGSIPSEVFRNEQFDSGFLRGMEPLAEIIAHSADRMIEQLCASAAGAANHLCARHGEDISDFSNALMSFVKMRFSCENVTLWLKDEKGDKLLPAGDTSTKIEWLHAEQFYTRNDGLTGMCWKRHEMIFASNALTDPDHMGKAREIRLIPPNLPRKQRLKELSREEILFAPLRHHNGSTLGIIRLQNKRVQADTNVSTMLTNDDAAILDAIIQTIVPHLKMLKERGRVDSLRNDLWEISHELKTPVATIRQLAGTIMMMEHEKRDSMWYPDGKGVLMKSEVIADLELFSSYIGYTLGSMEHLQVTQRSDLKITSSACLVGDVIKKAIRLAQAPLRQANLPKDAVQFENEMARVLPMRIDAHRLVQCMLNIINNSIKFRSPGEPFRMRIILREQGDWIFVRFEDNGLGVPRPIHLRQRLFVRGIRGKSLGKRGKTAGNGLGLAIVHETVTLHGGEVCFARHKKPTVLEIKLPNTLRT